MGKTPAQDSTEFSPVDRIRSIEDKTIDLHVAPLLATAFRELAHTTAAFAQKYRVGLDASPVRICVFRSMPIQCLLLYIFGGDVHRTVKLLLLSSRLVELHSVTLSTQTQKPRQRRDSSTERREKFVFKCSFPAR